MDVSAAQPTPDWRGAARHHTLEAMTTFHHFDAGAMHPVLGSLANDAGMLVDHVVAFTTPAGGLALVDTGIGTAAREDPRRHLGPGIARTARPPRDRESSVLGRLEVLGHSASDVTDIFITHLDMDHASGLADFPDATVHVHHRELSAARTPALLERTRYLAVNWAHEPTWAPYGESTPDAEAAGLAGHALLGGHVVAIPLPGHTRGHAGYAIRDGDGWLLHAGDAFYHEPTIHSAAGPRASRFWQVFEVVVAARPQLIRENHRKVRAAAATDGVRVVCSHDPALLAAAQRHAATRATVATPAPADV